MLDIDSNYTVEQIDTERERFSKKQNYTPYEEFPFSVLLLQSPLRKDQQEAFLRLQNLIPSYRPQSDIYFNLAKVG
jgi:hypothetical protein